MRIFLPPANAREPAAAAKIEGAMQPARKRRILCAEDHELIAELLTKVLTEAGYDVECAPDGRAAWKRLSPDPNAFDVLITDHTMPGLNGMELVRKLRRTAFGGKIVVYSGNLTSGLIHGYLELGVDHIAHKPHGPAHLVSLLAATG